MIGLALLAVAFVVVLALCRAAGEAWIDAMDKFFDDNDAA